MNIEQIRAEYIDRSVPAIANVMAALSTMGWPGDESSAA